MGPKKVGRPSKNLPLRTTRKTKKVYIETQSQGQGSQETHTNTSHDYDNKKQRQPSTVKHQQTQETLQQPRDCNIFEFAEQEPELAEQLDHEIAAFMRSFFRTEAIPSQMVIEVKQGLIRHLNRVIDEALHVQCVRNGRFSLVGAAEFVRVIGGLGQKYRHKIGRTLILEELQRKPKLGPIL